MIVFTVYLCAANIKPGEWYLCSGTAPVATTVAAVDCRTDMKRTTKVLHIIFLFNIVFVSVYVCWYSTVPNRSMSSCHPSRGICEPNTHIVYFCATESQTYEIWFEIGECVCVREYKTTLNTLSPALDALRNWCKARKLNQDSRKTIYFFFLTILFFTTRFTLWVHKAHTCNLLCLLFISNAELDWKFCISSGDFCHKKSNRKLACYLFK